MEYVKYTAIIVVMALAIIFGGMFVIAADTAIQTFTSKISTPQNLRIVEVQK